VKSVFNTTALAAAILFLMAACDGLVDNGGSDVNDGPTHFKDRLIITSQQVWERNSDSTITNKKPYRKYTGDSEVFFLVTMPDSAGGLTTNPIPIGFGKISMGMLSFAVDELEDNYLLAKDDFSICFGEWSNVTIDPPTAKGNTIVPDKLGIPDSGYLLNREELYGTRSSIALESILFIYVNTDCRIRGSYFEGRKGNHYIRTESGLDLYLKNGWNTVCRKETLNTSGYINVSMEIRNPNELKWAMLNQALFDNGKDDYWYPVSVSKMVLAHDPEKND
jgi:hypothetical protein